MFFSTFQAAFLLMFLPGVLAAPSAAGDLTADEWVSIGQCRANCMNKYTTYPAADSDCIDQTRCYMCWQMCERLHIPSWARLCEPSRRNLCPEGCQVACTFYAPDTDGTSADLGHWVFPHPPSVEAVADDQLVIDWQKAERHPASKPRPFFPIYVLFWRFEKQPEWKLACMTTEQWAEIDGPHREYTGLTFLLLAVLPDGVVLEVSIDPYSASSANQPDEPDYEAGDYGNSDPDVVLIGSDSNRRRAGPTPSTAPSVGPEASTYPPAYRFIDLGLSVEVDIGDDTGLRGLLTFDLSSAGRHGDRAALLTVSWGRVSCRVQQSLPGCDLPLDSHLSVLEDEKATSVILPDLTYNSKYWVAVRAAGGATQQMTFYTPRCRTPDETFARCRPDQRFESVALPALTREDLEAVQRANQLPMFITIGACLVVAILIVAVAIVTVRRHAALVELLKTKAHSFRQSIRSRASSFRSSISRGAASFQRSLRGDRRRRKMRDNPIYRSCTTEFDDYRTMPLPQRLLAAQYPCRYTVAADVTTDSTSSSTKSGQRNSRSLPDVSGIESSHIIYSTPHRKSLGAGRSKSLAGIPGASDV